ncbi:hypothetical protein [Xanthomonas cannabis]|uniref:Uncharacterized protein n=1 Tax=Xanthomonas cannabis TaxID=1885674 RepID=A0ABR6JL46_9XANT|nr:hypothetical protein [Xanthomonas cannabis]MBB4593533.1 hypothetical protein [Xanthomonas cannabis]MBB5523188.1 hypothetical protein [Xanthomonas cannabis]
MQIVGNAGRDAGLVTAGIAQELADWLASRRMRGTSVSWRFDGRLIVCRI